MREKIIPKLRYIFYSTFIISPIFIVWDILATHYGHWAFSTAHTNGFKFINLPIEELLFFIVVPFSCLFLLANIEYIVKDSQLKIDRRIFWLLIFIFIFSSLLLSSRTYTSVVLMSVAFFFIVTLTILPELLYSKRFYFFMGICFLLFLIFNTLLTAIPIVTYGESTYLGLRVATIPLEDFFYNFSLMGFYILFYRYFQSPHRHQKH